LLPTVAGPDELLAAILSSPFAEHAAAECGRRDTSGGHPLEGAGAKPSSIAARNIGPARELRPGFDGFGGLVLFSAMGPALTVFIDEGGDPGVRDGLRYAAGRHEWLCLSAVAVRSSREADLADWIAEMRAAANSRQAGALHYARITSERRKSVCEAFAKKPARCFVLASHKSNMREYINERIGRMMEGGKFYNWCTRLLLERVTAWAADWQMKEIGHVEPLSVVFAHRGGHDYDHFFSYVDLLAMQSRNGTLFLKSNGLHPETLDRTNWKVLPAERWAGLQLADTVASAFYQAANVASPTWDIEPAKALAPIMAGGANEGVTVWPLPAQAELPEASRPILRQYGYRF
jgi:hypothetical protein